jgi:hypothetical protein
MMYVYTALNLTVLAEDGTPDLTKMKRASKRKWVTSRFAPFASNMQVQGECLFRRLGSGELMLCSSFLRSLRLFIRDDHSLFLRANTTPNHH